MNNLRNLRKQKGFTLKELHEMTRIPVRTLEDWDSEKRQIQSYHRIKALSAALGCGMDILMTKEENCLYDGNKAFMCLIQKEEGVHITISVIGKEEDLEVICEYVIPREDALEMLKNMKSDKEVSGFLQKYRN